MSPFSYDKIPFGVKASNVAAVANFSSTLDDSYIFVIANNCNTNVYNNENSYDTVYNSFENAALYGVNIVTDQNNEKYHEAYIGIKSKDMVKKLAQFNKNNATISANIIPLSNTNYNIGSSTNKWKDIYTSYIHTDGEHITNINLGDKTTNDLQEGINHLYYTDQRFDDRLRTKTSDYVQNGTSNKFIVNNNYQGDLNVNGTLSACNLVIEGETTVLNTSLYSTEKFEIVNQNNGPAFKVTQTGYKDILQIYKGLNSAFVIDSNGNIGINNEIPKYNLDVLGTTKSSFFIGDGESISNINLSDKTTKDLLEDPSGCNLYYTPHRVGIITEASNINVSNFISNVNQSIEGRFDSKLLSKTLDDISNGTSNKYIVNGLYNGSMSVTQTLTAYDLNVTNSLYFNKFVEQNVNQASKTEIINTGIGPALKIVQNDVGGIYNVMEAYVGTSIALSIIQNGNIGINKLAPAYNLDVNGTIRANFLRGDGSNITNINLNDKTTRYLKEDPDGSNLYFTAARVANISDGSNTNTSNYVKLTSNLLINIIFDNAINTCNYINLASNLLSEKILFNENNTCNYIKISSNLLALKILESKYNTSNFVDFTSNKLTLQITSNENNTCNYIQSSSNDIIHNIFTTDYNISNYINLTSNQLEFQILTLNDNNSNYTNITNNQLTNYIVTNDSNISNYIEKTSNILANKTSSNDVNVSNYIAFASNYLTAHIYLNEYNTCNYIYETSNKLAQNITENSNYTLLSSNNLMYNIFDTSNYLKITSNELALYIINNENTTCNYIQNTSNLLVNQILLKEGITCNFIIATSNLLSHHIFSNEHNTCNYIKYNSNQFVLQNLDTCNYIKNSSNILLRKIIDNYTYIKDVDNALTNITTNNVSEGNTNLYYTDVRFDTRLLSKSLDDIYQGTSNKYIVKNNYNGNLNIEGTLSACNLVIEGDTTVLNTTLYTTERFEIINQSYGPAFKIAQSGNKDILQIFKDTENIFNIDSNGNIGIRKTNQQYAFDLNGTINASFIRGNGSLINNINLADKSTIFLQEDPNGSNLYYTPNRVGIIANASNIHSSNFTIRTSNLISNDLTKVQSNSFAYTLNTANTINKNINSVSTQLSLTSNLLAGNAYRLDERMSNYLNNTSNEIIYIINNFDNTTSNYISSTCNMITERMISGESNIYNYIDLSSNLLTNHVLDTCNFIVFTSNDISHNILLTSNTISSRITNLDTNKINEGNINLYYTNERFDKRLLSKNLDDINQGTSNIFIVNNNYKGNLNIEGTLSACNLIIEGDTTVLNTSVYQTEKLEITNSGAGPVLKITQFGNQNIFEIYDDDDIIFKIIDGGNIGIKNANPIYDFDVNGITHSTMFKGDGTLITNINLSDRNTSLLVEGSNQYYTPSRVGIIAGASNIHSSNYMNVTCNLIIKQVLKIEKDTCNYINFTSNYVSSRILMNEIDTCNYITKFLSLNGINSSNYTNITSNYITKHILANENNTSNYIILTSNNIIKYIYDTCNNIQKSIYLTSNIIIQNISSNDINISNYVNRTSNKILLKNIEDNANQSNFVLQMSNIVNGFINVKDINQSNYANNISNIIIINIQRADSNQSNYVKNSNNTLETSIKNTLAYSNQNLSNYVFLTSNVLYNIIQNNNNNQSNLSHNISNILLNRINLLNTNQSNYVLSTSNTLSILTNNYNQNQSNLIFLRDSNQSNYVFNTSNRLANYIQNINNNQSNYTRGVYNSLQTASIYINTNQSNYTSNISSNLYSLIRRLEVSDNSINNNIVALGNNISVLTTIININIINASNYILLTSNTLSNRISDTSNFVITKITENSNVISDRIQNLSLDQIYDGSSNKYIINNKYNNDLFVKGTLVTCNLIVDGATTTLNTTTYQTERLEIISNSFGPALKIQQYGNNDILSLYDDDNIVFKVCDGGNIGINNNSPIYNLDVDGITFSTYYIGDGSKLYNVNLFDRTTDMLVEGSNLYYTSERVGIIANASNMHMSNLVLNVSNLLHNKLTDTSNNLTTFTMQISDLLAYKIIDVSSRLYEVSEETSNSLTELITNNSNTFDIRLSEMFNNLLYINSFTSNILQTSIAIVYNNLVNQVNTTSNSLHKDLIETSNNVYITSNDIVSNIDKSCNMLYKYIYNSSNDILKQLNTDVYVIKNQLNITSSNIHHTLAETSNTLYNYTIELTKHTSNTLNNDIQNVSKELERTSNTLNNDIQNVSNELEITSNILNNDILNVSNELERTSNILNNDILNVSNELERTSNILNNDILNISKELERTSNILNNDILNVSNELEITSNNIIVKLVDTSNELYDIIFHISDILADEVIYSSNSIIQTIRDTSNNLQSNLIETSNKLNEYIIDTSGNINNNILNTSNNLYLHTFNVSNQLISSIYAIEDLVGYTSDIYDLRISNLRIEYNIILRETSNDINDSIITSSNNCMNNLYILSNEIHEQSMNTSNDVSKALKQFYNLNQNTCNTLIENILNISNILHNSLIAYTEQLDNIQLSFKNTSNKLYNDIDKNCNLIYETSSKLVNAIDNTSNLIKNIDNEINIKINNLSKNISNISNELYLYIDQSSNNLDTKIEYTSNKLLSYTEYIYNLLVNDIIWSSNLLNKSIINSSNELYQDLYNAVRTDVGLEIDIASNLLLSTSNAIYSSLYNTSNKFYNDLLTNLHNDMVDQVNLSNYISSSIVQLDNNVINCSNAISSRISVLTTDEINDGINNRFIINDCYKRDIVFTESVSATTVVTKSIINLGGIDIYNDQYNTPSLYIKHNNDVDDVDVVNICVNNIQRFVISNNGYIGVNNIYPEFDLDVNGILNATRLSGDGGLLTNVNLSDKTTDDILEGTCNLFFREERLDEMIMSKSIDMFQPGSNMSIIRNGIYHGSLLIAGQLTVNSLKVLDVNASYISSNTSNYGNGVFDDNFGVSSEFASNLEYNIMTVSNILMDTINNLNNIQISSLDQVGNGTSNKYIYNNIYNSSLNVLGKLQAEYVGGDGMFITNVNLLDKTTDDLKEGSRYYYSEDLFNNSIQNITTDYLQNGNSNRYIVNGVYEGDLIITGDLTVSRVQILDIFANVLNSNYETDFYNSSNSYVQSLASFIRNINANLVNDMKYLDHKLGLIMTCNMDETILGIIANDSNLLLNKFSETINYVNSNVSILNTDVYRNISNLIDYVNENVSKIEYYNYYTLDGSNISYVMDVVNSSNSYLEEELNNKIRSLTTNNVKEGVNLYYTPKRVGNIAYASNLHVSNYVIRCINEINTKLDNSNLNAVRNIEDSVKFLNTKIDTCNLNISNYLENKTDIIHNRINCLTLDEIANGCNNSYIKNNVYDGYLIVTGGIITNNIVISDLHENGLILSSNAKELLTSSSLNNNSNSFIQNLINKLNIQNEIIDKNNNIINLLTSNFQSSLNIGNNIDFALFSSNLDLAIYTIDQYGELIFYNSNQIQTLTSNFDNSLMETRNNFNISLNNLNNTFTSQMYSIDNSNLKNISDLQNDNIIQQQQILGLTSNLEEYINKIKHLESVNISQQNEIDILNINMQILYDKIDAIEKSS